MQALTYRCPYCRTTVDVMPDRVNETVLCPNPKCKRPFQLDAPVAKLVGTHEVEADEKVDLQASQPIAEKEETLTVTHPAMFRARPFTFIALFIVTAAGLAGAVWWWSRNELTGVYMALGVALIGLVGFAVWSLNVHCTKLTITTKRTLLKRGLIAKTTSEVRHNDVHLLNIEQTFLGRIFNVGTVSVSSAAGHAEPEIVVEGMPRPNELVQPIRKQQA